MTLIDYNFRTGKEEAMTFDLEFAEMANAYWQIPLNNLSRELRERLESMIGYPVATVNALPREPEDGVCKGCKEQGGDSYTGDDAAWCCDCPLKRPDYLIVIADDENLDSCAGEDEFYIAVQFSAEEKETLHRIQKEADEKFKAEWMANHG